MNALILATVSARDIKFGLKVLVYHTHIMSILFFICCTHYATKSQGKLFDLIILCSIEGTTYCLRA